MKNNPEKRSLSQQVAQLEERVRVLESILSNEGSPGKESKERAMSLGEFLLERKPSDDVKRTIAIAYFFENFEKMDSFNIRDLAKGFERARERKPINLNDKVNMAIRGRYLDEVLKKKNGMKAWHLTNTGISLVENNFVKNR